MSFDAVTMFDIISMVKWSFPTQPVREDAFGWAAVYVLEDYHVAAAETCGGWGRMVEATPQDEISPLGCAPRAHPHHDVFGRRSYGNRLLQMCIREWRQPWLRGSFQQQLHRGDAREPLHGRQERPWRTLPGHGMHQIGRHIWSDRREHHDKVMCSGQRWLNDRHGDRSNVSLRRILFSEEVCQGMPSELRRPRGLQRRPFADDRHPFQGSWRTPLRSLLS